MINCNDISTRLRRLVDKRNYFFKDTSRSDAMSYLKTKTDFQGLATPEILALEEKINKAFPDDFKTFLSVFGKNCGELFCNGQDFRPHEFNNYQEWAKELIEQHGIASFLTEKSFVFSFHQGYNFYFFDGGKNDDSVYFYMEGEPEPVKVYECFADLVESDLLELEQFNEEAQSSDGQFLTISQGRLTMTWPAQHEKISPRQIGDRYI